MKYQPIEIQIMAKLVLEKKYIDQQSYKRFMLELSQRTGITYAEAELRTHKLAKGEQL